MLLRIQVLLDAVSHAYSREPVEDIPLVELTDNVRTIYCYANKGENQRHIFETKAITN